MRAIAFIEGGEQKLFSRNGRNVTSQFPELADLPKQVKSSPFVLDGEIVCLDDDNHPNFSRVQQRLQAKRLGLKQPSPWQLGVLHGAPATRGPRLVAGGLGLRQLEGQIAPILSPYTTSHPPTCP